MIKKLGILLLIFIATVGLSSAASAQPIAQTAQGPTTYGHGGYGTHFWHWTIIRRFVVSSPFAVSRIRHIFPPPIYRVSRAYIGNHRWVVTVWRRSFSPIYRGTMRYPGIRR
ncbi:hypothetical protein [Methanobacterium sp.]|uniref:hypothetical protein n=1 Tax=Methanobacterium sp. TaxID=2164 RepID=UPI003C75C29E